MDDEVVEHVKHPGVPRNEAVTPQRVELKGPGG